MRGKAVEGLGRRQVWMVLPLVVEEGREGW